MERHTAGEVVDELLKDMPRSEPSLKAAGGVLFASDGSGGLLFCGLAL